MPTWLSAAISCNTVPTPPRVASRIVWMADLSGTAAKRALTVAASGAQSLVMAASMAKSRRATRMAAPWRPTSPVTMMASPALAREPEGSAPSSSSPMPVVVMKTPSTWPRPATFVSPATMRTPAALAVSAIAAAMASRSRSGKPSSIWKAQAR